MKSQECYSLTVIPTLGMRKTGDPRSFLSLAMSCRFSETLFEERHLKGILPFTCIHKHVHIQVHAHTLKSQLNYWPYLPLLANITSARDFWKKRLSCFFNMAFSFPSLNRSLSCNTESHETSQQLHEQICRSSLEDTHKLFKKHSTFSCFCIFSVILDWAFSLLTPYFPL